MLGRAVNRSRTLDPLLATLVSMGVGATALLGVGIATQGLPTPSAASVGIVVWLAVVNTAFAFTLWNGTLRHLTAVESSVINNTMLIQIAALAWAFLGEALSATQVGGIALVTVGTLVVQWRRRGAGAPPPRGGRERLPRGPDRPRTRSPRQR